MDHNQIEMVWNDRHRIKNLDGKEAQQGSRGSWNSIQESQLFIQELEDDIATLRKNGTELLELKNSQEFQNTVEAWTTD